MCRQLLAVSRYCLSCVQRSMTTLCVMNLHETNCTAASSGTHTPRNVSDTHQGPALHPFGGFITVERASGQLWPKCCRSVLWSETHLGSIFAPGWVRRISRIYLNAQWVQYLQLSYALYYYMMTYPLIILCKLNVLKNALHLLRPEAIDMLWLCGQNNNFLKKGQIKCTVAMSKGAQRDRTGMNGESSPLDHKKMPSNYWATAEQRIYCHVAVC